AGAQRTVTAASVKARGTIRIGARRASFRLDVVAGGARPVVVYTDLQRHLRFMATKLTTVRIDRRSGTATLAGAGVDLSRKHRSFRFTLKVVDGKRVDVFRIALSNGYRASGEVVRSAISIR